MAHVGVPTYAELACGFPDLPAHKSLSMPFTKMSVLSLIWLKFAIFVDQMNSWDVSLATLKQMVL